MDIKDVKRAGAPLAVIETNDPAETIKRCRASLNGNEDGIVLMEYDLIRGMVGLSDFGKAFAADNGPEEGFTMGPVDWLKILGEPSSLNSIKGIVFWHQVNSALEAPEGIQAIWNLRDVFKVHGWNFIGLSESVNLPGQLRSDFVIMTEEAPDEKKVGEIVDEVCKNARKAGAKISEPYEDREKAVDACLGLLSSFDVEQSLSLSTKKDGIHLPTLWERKKSMVSRVPGLSVWNGTQDFKDLVGSRGVKSLLSRYLKGRRPPRVIFFLDELEKMVGGVGDTSGTSQAVQEQFLSWTTDNNVDGMILLGVPGAGKSHTAKCTAGAAGIPCLQGSLSTVKGGIVGQTESNMKAMLKTVDAIGQGNILMIATCNGIESLTPELMARFRLGTFFFDFPSKDEQSAIWDYYKDKYDHRCDTPVVQNWVGREIEACCQLAWTLDIPLKEAQTYIVPVCKSAKKRMDALRNSVSGRFLSASIPGIYEVNKVAADKSVTRQMEV